MGLPRTSSICPKSVCLPLPSSSVQGQAWERYLLSMVYFKNQHQFLIDYLLKGNNGSLHLLSVQYKKHIGGTGAMESILTMVPNSQVKHADAQWKPGVWYNADLVTSGLFGCAHCLVPVVTQCQEPRERSRGCRKEGGVAQPAPTSIITQPHGLWLTIK